MSDPNAQHKKRQIMILGGAAAGVLALVGAGMFLFDAAPAASRERPKTVSITPPGTVDDKDAWRANEAARAKVNETNINDMKGNVKRLEESNARLAKELEDLRTGKAKLPGVAGAASAPVSSNPPPERIDPARAQAVLNQPLPGQGGMQQTGQKILTPPTGSGTPVGGLNQPIRPNSAADAAARRENEIITFGPGPGTGGTASSGTSPSPEVVGFPVDEKAKKVRTSETRDAGRSEVEFMPAGSFVRVALLNGVDAPTGGQAQSNPLPMALHVVDTANLSNQYKLDIRDCRFIAAAWGDLSSERTMGRTETLSCIINGEATEMAVRGQIVGEDGKVGIRGRLVTKQGQLLANALFAGALSGIGKAFQQSATVTTAGAGGVTQSIDQDKVTQAAIGGGVGTAANSLAQYYLKAADKLFPVIETDGGRVVEILITKGAVYKGKTGSRDQMRALLKRNGNPRSNDDD